MKILSCGAGMQSTALALISCEQTQGKIVYPEVPRYDAIIYCDLGIEPAWVPEQVGLPEQRHTILYSEKRSLPGLYAKLWHKPGFRYAFLDIGREWERRLYQPPGLYCGL